MTVGVSGQFGADLVDDGRERRHGRAQVERDEEDAEQCEGPAGPERSLRESSSPIQSRLAVMADFARYLPLSARPPQDETGVSSHWGADIAAVLEAVADLLAVQPAASTRDPEPASGLERPRRRGLPVVAPRRADERAGARDVAGPGRERLQPAPRRRVVRTPRRRPPRRRARRRPPRHRRRQARRPRTHGHQGARHRRRRAASTSPDRSGAVLPLRPAASGAVALRRALNGPTEIKAVIRDRSLTATDAEWSFGRGPAMSDTAEAILLFLYERSDRAPGSGV